MKTMNTWQTVKTKPISTTNMYQRQDTHTPQPADQTEVMTVPPPPGAPPGAPRRGSPRRRRKSSTKV